ncbi:hypothetical protein P3T51_10960 [Weissella confusa]|nr:hypothetical protein [Weissella confusa]WEY48040.1 hypothetical protein P3T51_10960 [Weissella confusa]
MTPYDEQLVAHMKLREHHMKRRQVTTNKILGSKNELSKSQRWLAHWLAR